MSNCLARMVIGFILAIFAIVCCYILAIFIAIIIDDANKMLCRIGFNFVKKNNTKKNDITSFTDNASKNTRTLHDISEKYLLNMSKTENREEKQKLTKYTFNKIIELIESTKDFDINAQDEHEYLPIEYVLRMYDSLEYVKQLIEKYGADPTKTGKNNVPLICWAFYMANIEIYDYWLENNYHNVQIEPESDILLMCIAGDTTLEEKYEFLLMLKNTGKKINCEELSQHFNTPLIVYIIDILATPENFRNRDLLVDTLKLILSFGVDIDEKDIDGMTGLLMSVSSNYIDKIKLYLELGANLYATENNGLGVYDLISVYDRNCNVRNYLTKTMFQCLSDKINNLEKENEELKTKFAKTIIEC